MKVVFFGFMGSGKTTYGKMFAERMKLQFIDLDDYIEATRNKTIKQIFESEGEAKFRETEREAMLEVLEKDNFILAAGGGTPCFFDNVDFMNKKAITVYLEANIEILVNRLMEAKLYRPLIWGKSKEDLQKYIEETLQKRNPFYRKAHITVNANDLNINSFIRKLNRIQFFRKILKKGSAV